VGEQRVAMQWCFLRGRTGSCGDGVSGKRVDGSDLRGAEAEIGAGRSGRDEQVGWFSLLVAFGGDGGKMCE